MKREEINRQRMLCRREKIMKISLRNIGKINNDNSNNNCVNNNANNVDQLLLKLMEEKKMDAMNDIKNQLFPIKYKNKNTNENNYVYKEIANEDDKKDDIDDDKQKLNQGFIIIKLSIKKLSSLMVLIKQFLKKEGYNLIKKDIDKLEMELSNGEIDVLLSFEKMIKEIKISFSIKNGNKVDFHEFKKIMKKFSSLKRK